MNNLLTKHKLDQKSRIVKFQNNLLGWYDKNKRALPWRTEPSLYKTVVSEFMLQQTRVSTVLPYFRNWIETFPDFKILAKSKEEKVLKNWEGLGYYSRARNLHKLSNIVCSWDPISKEIKDWQALPGVGPYISAAITSISFNQSRAVCDGNVVRVLTRIFANSTKFKDGATAQKKLQPLAQTLINGERPGDYNQAIMELGATICHRQSPLCTICPVLSFCVTGQRGDSENFPAILKKKKVKQNIERFWIEYPHGLLLQKAEKNSKRMPGIYELPKSDKFSLFRKRNLITRKKRTIGLVDYCESIYKASIDKKNIKKNGSFKWIQWENIDKVTISGPHRKWIKEIRNSTF